METTLNFSHDIKDMWGIKLSDLTGLKLQDRVYSDYIVEIVKTGYMDGILFIYYKEGWYQRFEHAIEQFKLAPIKVNINKPL